MSFKNISLGVISDTHGDVQVCRHIWKEYLKNAELVLHAGDVFYHGPRNPFPKGYDPQALAEFLNQSSIPLLFARGNCDADVDQFVLNYPLQSPYVFTMVEGLKIMITHGTDMDRDKLLYAAENYGVDLLVSGHTHERVLEKTNGTILLNPGSPSLPKGDGMPSIAMIENGTIKIYNLENGEVLTELVI